MAKKYEVGDIHAPVEDLEVPFSLKLLVLFIFTAVVSLIGFIIYSVDALRILLFGA